MALERVESNGGINGDPEANGDDSGPPCKISKTTTRSGRGVLDALLTSQKSSSPTTASGEERSTHGDVDEHVVQVCQDDEPVLVVKPSDDDDDDDDDDEDDVEGEEEGEEEDGSAEMAQFRDAETPSEQETNGECQTPPSRAKGPAGPTPPSSGYFTCAHCNKFFWSEASLKHHSSLYHSEKSFVCEICSKAFRFRSNLAEHRSVHTSLKPYVCRFCGKSSRLKGNLTKHILKHHKREQNAFIGKDDIIIKKGKKSVKDPAAVDFLEKSMIILTSEQAALNTSPTQALNNNDQLTKANRYFGAIKENASQVNGGEGGYIGCLGDGAELHMPSSKGGATAQAPTPCRSRRPVGSANSDESRATTTVSSSFTPASMAATFPYMIGANDQSANAALSKLGAEEVVGKACTASAKVLSLSGSQSSTVNSNGTRCQICQKHFRKAANLALHLTVKHRFPPPKEPESCAGSTSSVARLNDLLQFAGDNEPLDLKRRLFRDTPTTMSSSSTIALEKLSGIAAAAAAAAAASSPMFGAPESAGASLSLDLKEVKNSLAHLKQAANESAKVESVVRSLEARMSHIERQVETTASTLFAVFHMQTEMHNAFCNFRGDMVEQLKTLLRYMREQT